MDYNIQYERGYWEYSFYSVIKSQLNVICFRIYLILLKVM